MPVSDHAILRMKAPITLNRNISKTLSKIKLNILLADLQKIVICTLITGLIMRLKG